MGYEVVFLVAVFSVFILSARKEKKAKIFANGICGLLSLILFNLVLPVKTGFNLFSIGMAVTLGFPAVIAMTLVKML